MKEMIKFLFTMMSLVLLASCSVKTNEEKARELIEPQIKANLVKPESYEFSQIHLDSCFSDYNERNADAIEFVLKLAGLFGEYKGYASDAERAESSMTIYAPSYGYQSAHSAQQHKKYKAEMEKAQRKAAAIKEQIIQLYRDNKQFIMNSKYGKHEFTGWVAEFGYRAETAGGMKRMGRNLFFLNKELTDITHSFTEEDMMRLQFADLDDLKYEFEEELKEIFED